MRKVYLFMLSFLLMLPLRAQQFNFKTYSVDQGLIQSQVLSISQDANGFIWIATHGGGVSRFEGNNFKSYTIYEGLPSNHVFKIFGDSKGNVWVGTNEGLAVFKNDRFERVKNVYGLRDDHIWDIIEDSKGNILIGTKNYGVFIYNGISYKNYAINDGLGFSFVNKLYEDKDGNIWIGSEGYGLAKYDGKKFENVTQKMHLKGLYVRDVYTDANNKLIVCTEEGLNRKDGSEFVVEEKSFRTNRIMDVEVDDAGITWFATFGNGLFAEDKNRNIKSFSEENGLPSNYINTLFLGQDGKIWIGTDGAGFSRFSGERFIHYNKSNILKNNIVSGIAVTPDSSYWFATEEGLSRYFKKENSVIFYNESTGLESDNFRCIDVSPSGVIWAGTDEGIYKIDSRKGKDGITFFKLDDGVFAICAAKENEIWAGTQHGILFYNGREISKRFRDSIPNTSINRIKKGLNGEILFCTEISFSIYDEKKLYNYKIADNKGSKEIIDVWPGRNATYWLATNRGLTVIDKSFNKKHFNSRDGLSSDNLYLVCYFNNAVWIGGDRGLDKISFDSDNEITAIKHYDKDDGFIGVECNLGAFLMEEDKIWIGTIKGVTVYQPKFDVIDERKPKLHLKEIKLNYESVNWADAFPGMKMKDNIPQNPELSYNQNNLSFEFIALDYNNPEEIYYQYKLDGFNAGWLPLTKENSVSYTNLPPGEYTFMVKAFNSEGVISNVLKYEFKIHVPFWRSTLFFIILIPSLLISVYVFILIRTRQLNRTKRKLEETVRLRTMELNKQKNELEKLSIVADKMNDGVVICQPDGKIEWINDGFRRMTGFASEEFTGTDLASKKYLQQLSSHKEIDQIVKNFHSNRESVIYDSTHTMKNGVLMWTRAALTPIYNEKNELIKIVALYSDITDHIKYEETLAQTNKDLTDSIVYAKKIQEAILPERMLMDETFPDYFIYYNPRDIVSGDFYWFTKLNAQLILAVADCTGHGVPGAFMSMIGNEFLHQTINISSVSEPDKILKELNKRVTQSLHQSGGDLDSRDGMDIAVCAINLTTLFTRFSGAHIPMFVIRNNELLEYEATKESVGGHNDGDKLFLQHEFNLQKGDCIYFTTDGYVDQFGGNEGKKLMRKRFKELLKRYAHLPMKDQHAMLFELHHDWRGMKKQTDDILIVGIRIS